MKDGLLTLSDLELLLRVKKGDRAAFAMVYNRYGEILYRILLQKTPHSDDARDILHDVFERIWVRRKVLPDDLALFPYLFRSVQNRSLDLIRLEITRRKYVESFRDFATSENDTTAGLELKDLLSIIRAELTSLPPNTQAVLEMRIIEGFTNKEIATLLDLTENAVKSHVKRGIKVLKTKKKNWVLLFIPYKFFFLTLFRF